LLQVVAVLEVLVLAVQPFLPLEAALADIVQMLLVNYLVEVLLLSHY
jgi:hypothetical protein